LPRRGRYKAASQLTGSKYRVDPEFVRLLDQAADVVADDLAENLVDHRDIGLAV
jgi:hypothetical protein